MGITGVFLKIFIRNDIFLILIFLNSDYLSKINHQWIFWFNQLKSGKLPYLYPSLTSLDFYQL